jgi:methyl-accepting chemotaxis protein-1 (serine sensor receptor)
LLLSHDPVAPSTRAISDETHKWRRILSLLSINIWRLRPKSSLPRNLWSRAMNRLKISTRMVLLIGALSILLLAIGGLGLYGVAQSNAALLVLYQQRAVPMGQVAEIQARLLRNRLAIAVSLVTPTPDEIAANTGHIEANIAEITRLWDAYSATALTPDEERIAKAFAADRKKFVVEGLRPTVAALRANDLKEAQRLVVDAVRPLYGSVDSGIKS